MNNDVSLTGFVFRLLVVVFCFIVGIFELVTNDSAIAAIWFILAYLSMENALTYGRRAGDQDV